MLKYYEHEEAEEFKPFYCFVGIQIVEQLKVEKSSKQYIGIRARI
jgi:hypothetical protein